MYHPSVRPTAILRCDAMFGLAEGRERKNIYFLPRQNRSNFAMKCGTANEVGGVSCAIIANFLHSNH